MCLYMRVWSVYEYLCFKILCISNKAYFTFVCSTIIPLLLCNSVCERALKILC